MPRPSTGARPYRTNRAILLSQSDTCGVCGHPGARTADHVIPAKLWPRGADGRLLPGLDDLSNLRPAHGSAGSGPGRIHNPCPSCGRMCNQSRGARIARRPQSQMWFPKGVPRA